MRAFLNNRDKAVISTLEKPTQANTDNLRFCGFSGVLKIISEAIFALFSPKTRHTPLLTQKGMPIISPKTRGIAVFSPIGGLFYHKGAFLLNHRF